ncbi:MAG TPA: ATP-binding protein [Candidatus Angelobacter sp.]
MAKKPELIIQSIEEYLAKVAKAIPQKIQEDVKLLECLTPILQGSDDQSELLRRALGFPSKIALSRSLLKLLRSEEPSLSTLIRVCAQRIYQLLWRFKYTLKKIDEAWTDEELPKVAAFSNLCQPYLMTQRPRLTDLQSVLSESARDSGADMRRFSESVADPILFAVLRALEYEREELSIDNRNPNLGANERAALNFLYQYLAEVCADHNEVNDSSNVWWALRLGIEWGDSRFGDLLGKMIIALPQVKIPSLETRAASVVPEIYTPLRSSAYTLASIESILEAPIKISSEVQAQLEAMIPNMLQPLLDTPFSKNVYLASVHYEGLRAFLDYTENKELLFPAVRSGKLSISDFCPVGKFTCVDPELKGDIAALHMWLSKGKANGKRSCVLVYGASSTGKTFLVDQFFRHFEQGEWFKKGGRVVCSPDTDLKEILSARLAEALEKIPAGSVAPAFIYIDEADVERRASIFPVLLQLVETGRVEGMPAEMKDLKDLVLFWGGGKHGSVESLRLFLTEKQASPDYEKGLDLFNRSSRKMNLPATLLRNKNLKVLMGLSEIINQNSNPSKVDTSVLKALREIPMAHAQGARTFETFVLGLTKDKDGVIFKPKLSRSDVTVEVTS